MYVGLPFELLVETCNKELVFFSISGLLAAEGCQLSLQFLRLILDQESKSRRNDEECKMGQVMY